MARYVPDYKSVKEGMKSVAIIGAGPSGLVTAKAMLRAHPDKFQVTLFEKSSKVGGLWVTDTDPKEGLIDPEMRTNISQFTVVFSDLAWDSIDIDSHEPVSMFPKAWQVQRYLEHYCRKFIPSEVIEFNTEVTRARRIQNDTGFQWKLSVANANCQGENSIERTFDYLVIASGFFSKPRAPSFELPEYIPGQKMPNVIHSAMFRNLSDLFENGKVPKQGKVLVVGGSHSGGDTAAALALQMSNEQNGPQGSGQKPLEILHVMPRPLFALAPYVQAGDGVHAFVPLDLPLYELSKRPPGPIKFMTGRLTTERIQMLRGRIKHLMDGSTPGLTVGTGETEELIMPYVTIIENYVEYVRSGAISPTIGRVLSLARKHANNTHNTAESEIDASVSATVSIGSSINEIDEVVAVVYATGYTASTALGFLDDDVKSQLGFDPSYPRLPLFLEKNHVTSSAKIPDLAFIGFKDGPYWGGMEMQARLVAKRWSADHETAPDADIDEDLMSVLKDYREAMASDKSAVPQNLFGDYVGFMEEVSRSLQLQRLDQQWTEREGPVTPARHIDTGSDIVEARNTITQIETVKSDAVNKNKFAARAVFRGILGKWNTDNRDGSGKHTPGVVQFSPRLPTDSKYDFEYLCTSSHPLLTSPGGHSRSGTHMVWRYSESKDTISIWTTKSYQDKVADALLSEMSFNGYSSESTELNDIWRAVAKVIGHSHIVSHNWSFQFRGVAIESFSLHSAILSLVAMTVASKFTRP